MTTDVDDVLRTQLRELAAHDVPIPPASDVERDVQGRVVRRRRRRRVRTVALAAMVVAVGVSALIARGSGPDRVVALDPAADGAGGAGGAATPPPPPPLDPPLTIERIEARGGPDGTEEVAVVFDGPVPDDVVSYVYDMTSVDVPGLGYSLQGPSGLWVCHNRHYFGATTDVGSIDLLIPNAWLTSADPAERPIRPLAPGPGESAGPPSKIAVCGPYHDYVQVSIWGPASNAPDDVEVSVSDDGTRLVVEIT